MLIQKIKNQFIKWRVHFLAICFGLSTWIGVNGSYVQLPLLIEELPEGWKLASFLSIVVQLGNLGPILYSLFRRFKNERKWDRWIIIILLLMAILAMLFMALFFNITSPIGDERYSLTFLILVWFVALVGCTSSVLFMPYMRYFHAKYLVFYFIGEGFSGLTPSILALIQGTGLNDCGEKTEPLFTTQVFFSILVAFFVASLASFLLMDKLRSLHITNILPISQQVEENLEKNDNEFQEKEKVISLKEVYLLNALSGGVCFFSNGFLPSIQSYSCMPYGTLAYHLAVTLAAVANPVACMIGPYLPEAGRKSIISISAFVFLLIVYICTTAALSPHPPLQDSVAGIALCVIVWILVMGLIAYVKMAIARRFVSHVGPHNTGQALFYCGSWQQIGSCIGAILAFVLINNTDRFQSYDPCLAS